MTIRKCLIKATTLFIGLLVIATTVAAEDPIKVGAILALSGNGASYGEWGRRGISIAIDEINSDGGVKGQKLTAILEDGQGLPAKSVSAYQKLRTIDKVDYLLTAQSSVALAIAPLTNRDQVAQIDFSATTPKYSSPDDYTFRTGIIATQLATEAASMLTDQFGVKRVACLYIENDFGQGMFDAFQKNFRGKIVEGISFPADQMDYRAQLLKLKQANVDHIWLVGHLVEAGVVVKQARNLGIDAQFYSDIYTVEGKDFITAADNSANGLIYIAPTFEPERKGSVPANFAAQYRAKYNELATPYAAQGYDAVYALTLAMRKCDTLTPTCVKNELYKVDFEGGSGRIKFDRNGDVQKQTSLKWIDNGEFVPYAKGEK